MDQKNYSEYQEMKHEVNETDSFNSHNVIPSKSCSSPSAEEIEYVKNRIRDEIAKYNEKRMIRLGDSELENNNNDDNSLQEHTRRKRREILQASLPKLPFLDDIKCLKKADALPSREYTHFKDKSEFPEKYIGHCFR